MKQQIIITMLVILVIFISGCAAYKQPTTQATTPTTPTGEVKEFTIRGSSFKLNPSSITVNKGDIIKITFINEGGGHNLCVEGKGCTKTISSGQSDTLQFTADNSGALAFFCSVPGHRQSGMEGKLIVS